MKKLTAKQASHIDGLACALARYENAVYACSYGYLDLVVSGADFAITAGHRGNLAPEEKHMDDGGAIAVTEIILRFRDYVYDLYDGPRREHDELNDSRAVRLFLARLKKHWCHGEARWARKDEYVLRGAL